MPVLLDVQVEKGGLNGRPDMHCTLQLCGRGRVWSKESLKCNVGGNAAQSVESSPSMNKALGSIPNTAPWDKDKKSTVSELEGGIPG